MKSWFLFCSCVLSVTFVIADTHYVDIGNTSPSAPYTSWATAANDIQTAIESAADGDTVLVNDGHYVLASTIEFWTALTICSVNGASSTIIDGNNAVGCLTVGGYPCLLEGFTITGGNDAKGGGISCTGESSQIISNCVIKGNSSGSYAGGVWAGNLYNCVITNNYAAEYGGGLSNGSAYNCLIAHNTSGIDGGGLNNVDHVNNCTIVENTASTIGGGAANCRYIKNSIVWFNQASHGSDCDNVGLENSCTPDTAHGVDGNITNAPMFSGNGNYHLLPSSPCINAGSNAFVTTSFDLDGKPRILAGTVDMGAYEGIFNFNITKCSSAGSSIIIEWEATAGMNSIVKYSPDLSLPDFTSLSPSLPYPQNCYTTTVHSTDSKCFYRVDLE